ncbi:MAG: hypothetical protein JWN96_4593 [Mycobacterium sp.]|jgi:hypothetical protein|nr:hypothetical protein [Mycobacterium sp.]
MAAVVDNRPSARWTNLIAARSFLVLAAVCGLGLDAYVHFDLASRYAPIKTSTISQADLFRVEAVVAILAALAVLLRPRRYTAAIATVVAGSALAVLLVYRYADIGSIGPIPSMYEPVWFTEKLVAFWSELAATVASLALLAFVWVSPRTSEKKADAHG